MSRIIVKCLPARVTEDRLRDIFSSNGDITDLKLMRSQAGRSRQFAFIGYRTEHEAEKAMKYFNKSFIDTSQITVEFAHKVGDKNTPRPWSRYSLRKVNENCDKSSNEILSKKIKKKPDADDPQLQQFVDVMLRGKSKIWSNDMWIAPPASKEKDLVKKADAKKRKAVTTSDDDMEYFKRRIKKNLSDSDSYSDEYEVRYADLAGNDDGEAGADGPIDGDDRGGLFDKVNDDDAMDGQTPQQLKVDSDDVLNTGRLFVCNIPYTSTEEELIEHFNKFGEISEVHLVLDKETKRSKGIAFIRYTIPDSAARAMQKFDVFQGRVLHVSPAKHRETPDKQVNDASKLPKTLKQKREEQRKASEAGGNTKAWNSFFMRSDTILENIVRKYGVSKGEYLDREAHDPAVLLALGEARVIAETKEALAKAGINVTSLEGRGDDKNRSKHILLVKNLPFASSEKELAQMFGRFGSLDKIVLPPTKTMALVVFLEPAEARAAFKGMAYKQYKDAPLYLEWAPGDIMEPKTLPGNCETMSDVGVDDVRRVSLEQQVKIDTDITESNVLYVTNLSFKTTDESLKKRMTQLVTQGKILSVKIIKHVKHGEKVSSGYGFVEFDSIETATSVYRDVQGTVLDGFALKFRFCENKRSYTVEKGSDKDKKASTKLIVKNVPFEATKGQLRELLNKIGQIKGLRLPKRNISQDAGFAFVDFMTKQEASKAKNAISNLHLYGRHLVAEWSNDNNSMKALREHSAAKYMDQ